ncbi:MAG: S9 family peptidase, partial [Firmicutes bacterium]|nr:S9 family peptidase [Bacillota bacterium]
SYLYPTTIFRYELADNSLTKFFQPTITFDPNQFETKQVFYPSKDGTRIPLFLTYKKELQLDGNNPTLLYGYGGYNISMTPAFSPHIIAWLEKGGVYAVACLRGGSEYGEEWHRAGMLENKQNVFDDFIAAAEWLIAEGYTCTPKLAIMGRSNGGLLVGACITQRPELYGAAICWVGVLDMLRYHLFSAGRYWTGEYGNAIANADHFRFMYRFSPIHNVKFATVYPPTLIRTAETDDRVVPMHSLKFYGALQSAAGNPEDIYLLVERKAGHGAGKPIGKQIDEFADILAFICAKLGVE